MATPERAVRRATRSVARKGNNNGGGADTELDLRKLLRALQAVRDGDFSVRLASDQTGIAGKVADTFNEIVASNHELTASTHSSRTHMQKRR